MQSGLYIHIPFCASKCRYCDFYSITDAAGQHRYTDTLLREIERYAGRGITADSLFFGGGTPSLMEADELKRLLDACRDVFQLDGEITMEANPDSVSAPYLAKLREAGINRISFGAQSANDRELAFLGRRHSARRIAEAVQEAKDAGFSRISLDVMLGIPYQTRASLADTLSQFVGLGVGHISAYMLKIEPGTPFARENVQALCPDEDETAELYLQTVSTLADYGLFQYEISNFAKPGEECRHNVKYWKVEDYIGFGPAAHSCLQGRRFYHPAGLSEYFAADGQNFMEEGPGGSREEKLMLGLRLAEGVVPEQLGFSAEECGRLHRKAELFQKAGYMRLDSGVLHFTPEGFLVSNSILAELLEEIELE